MTTAGLPDSSLPRQQARDLGVHRPTEFLDDQLISASTCPPHVHALNGVAERVIRSIMELARASMHSSGCPIGFWDYAVDHAVDILNRTTGPPECTQTAYELVTGDAP